VGPGLRSVRIGADGNIYVLAGPNDHVAVFGEDGKLLKNIPDYPGAGVRNPQTCERFDSAKVWTWTHPAPCTSPTARPTP